MAQDVKLKSGETLTVESIPDGHEISYLARSLEDKTKFYVVHAPGRKMIEEDEDHNIDYYNEFGLYIGNEELMRKAEVFEVNRFRDGGTTFIPYLFDGKKGELFFPAALVKRLEKSPQDSYDGKTVELEKLSEAQNDSR